MDRSISQDQQHIVVGLTKLRPAVSEKSLEDWSEESWTAEFDVWQCLSVRTQNPGNSLDKRSLWITVQWETMVDFGTASELIDTTEPVEWEHLIVVVLLNNATNHVDRSFILVLRAHKVKAVIISQLTIRSCVVDSDSQVELPSGPQVVNHSRNLWIPWVRIGIRLRLLLREGSQNYSSVLTTAL